MRRLLLGAVLACLPTLAWAQPGGTCTTGTCTTIAKWDCSSSYPGCNADAVGSLTFFTRSNLGAIGPNGETVVRTTHTGQTDTSPTGEYYVNRWEWTVPGTTQGQCRYHRLIWRVRTPILWNDDGGGRFGVKFVTHGTSGTFDANRFIANFRSDLGQPGDSPHQGNQVMMRSEKNVDGGVTRAQLSDIEDTSEDANGWHFWQWETCSSSTAVATDASLKVWRNSNTYASPTVSATGGFAWDTTGWTYTALDLYAESLGIGQNAVYDIAAYEYDDQFDSNWYHTGGSGVVKRRFRFR